MTITNYLLPLDDLYMPPPFLVPATRLAPVLSLAIVNHELVGAGVSVQLPPPVMIMIIINMMIMMMKINLPDVDVYMPPLKTTAARY